MVLVKEQMKMFIFNTESDSEWKSIDEDYELLCVCQVLTLSPHYLTEIQPRFSYPHCDTIATRPTFQHSYHVKPSLHPHHQHTLRNEDNTIFSMTDSPTSSPRCQLVQPFTLILPIHVPSPAQPWRQTVSKLAPLSSRLITINNASLQSER